LSKGGKRNQGVDTRDGQNSAEIASKRSARAPAPQHGEGAPTFDEIYREHGGRILNLLNRFTSREQVARDLLQDVFVKVYEQMNTFENRSQIYTWIYRIAVNHALNHLKREKRNLWFNVMDESVGELLRRERIETPGFGAGEVLRPDEVLEDRERERFTQHAVDALHAKYRIPFVLLKDEHLSYDEIAKVLDISLSAVESRIHRARKMLIKRLGPLIR
jgi:RNA polymerase sigma-70 factor (ECF subfamily)